MAVDFAAVVISGACLRNEKADVSCMLMRFASLLLSMSARHVRDSKNVELV
jgi:hypothetical protein